MNSEAEARALAEMMFPRDPKSPEFFIDDVLGFLTGLILHIRATAPAGHQNLGTLMNACALPPKDFRNTLIAAMLKSSVKLTRDAANNVLQKEGGTGQSLKNLRDTLHSKLSLFASSEIIEATDRDEINFRQLKDRPATVYIEVPFDLVTPYAPLLKVILRGALDAMIVNPAVPKIPVLFVLDEFLALEGFPALKAAIRTHAGAGVRLWFFLQDLGSLQEQYPGTSWQAFFNASVKQFFGTDETFTARLISDSLSKRTIAYRTTSEGSNVSAQIGENGGAGLNLSSNEGVAFLEKSLLTPEEVLHKLSAWRSDGSRAGVVQLRDPPYPLEVRLESYKHDEECQRRVGALTADGRGTNND